MNIPQRDQLIQIIEGFDVDELKASLAEYCKDEEDINATLINGIPVAYYLSLTTKVIKQLHQELEDSGYITLPTAYSYGGEIGNGNLVSDLSSLISHINSENFNASTQFLLRLAHYQRVNGFWELNIRRTIKKSEKKITEETESLELQKIVIRERIEELKDIKSEAEQYKNNVLTFLNENSSQVKTLEAALQNLINQSDNINNMYTNASNVVEKINSQLSLGESKRKDIESLHDESKEELSDIKSKLSEIKNENNDNINVFNALKSSFEEKLSFVEDKHSLFIERNKYLDDLIGREVGASLFETFKQRKNELSPSVTFWKFAVPLLAFFCIVWVFLLFHWSEPQQIDYKILLINSLKALPAIGLLLFGIAQYGKERNFQEEYAFKSAVALTLNSYAEQLLSDENKDALILASVSSIYKSPIHQSKIKIEDGKSAVESLSDLISKIKEIKPKTKE